MGDYTHGLATEARRSGIPVATIAIADRHILSETVEERNGIPFIRLPATLKWSSRLRHLSAALDEFNPEWLSLQFVPYSFHRRGWVHGLAHRLKPLLSPSNTSLGRSQARSLHLMFHELWLGTYSGAPWKHRLEGLWQRYAILAFVRAMRPAVVHTTNPVYARALQRHGVKAQILPLFGNIPIEATPAEQQEADAWWHGELQAMGLPGDERQRWWIFGVFGAIHPEWWPGELFNSLLARPASERRRLALVTLGRSGPNAAGVIQRLEREFAGRLHLKQLGEQSPARVAAVFRHLDFGIATSPWELIGKSGSAAAMRDHGVPVIVTRTSENPAERLVASAMEDPLLFRFDSALPAQLPDIHRQPASCRRSSITKRWLESLQPAGGCP